ncbi:MAG: STAS/SEC14 domain-containing protein [Caldilinea sp. CFX5]|nr:STAS/SEC14 domain-containing protein [Caldilinea sp. CFX5]
MTVLLRRQSEDDLLEAVAGLEIKEFDRFVDKVLAMQARRRTQTLSAQEADLLQQVNLGIAPDTWRRYDELKAKRRAATLSAAEHAELIAIGDQIELANARRIKALIQLASLRNTTLDALMDQLGIRQSRVE